MLLASAAALLFQAAPWQSAELYASVPPGLFADEDNDGLNDDFELYLNSASSSIDKTASPFNADSDGDGQPDGFEYCLSGGTSVYSPETVHPVVPKLTISCFQADQDLIVGVHSIPPFDSVDDLIARIAFLDHTTNQPVMVDFLGPMLGAIEAVGSHVYQGHELGSYQFRIPTSVVTATRGMSIGVRASVAGEEIGHTVNLGKADGHYFRWVYEPLPATPDASDEYAVGEAQPLAVMSKNATQDEVCGTVDRREPTGTPGLLRSVVLLAGCSGGEWACPAGVCTMSGSVAMDKLVIDVMLIGGSGGN